MKYLPFIFCLALLASCVPTKKYEDMQNKYFEQLQLNQDKDAEIHTLNNDYDVCRKQYLQLEAELSACRGTVDSLLLVINGMRNEIGILNKDLEATRLSKETDLGEAQQQINKAQADLLQKELELERKRQELALKEQELAQLAKRANELEALLNSQKASVDALKRSILDALTGFTDSELSVTVKDGKVYVSMSDKLLFKSGSTYVEPRGVEALGKVAEVIKKQADIQVVVEGHTDNVPLKGSGDMKDNWDLSVLRATSVVKILTVRYSVPVRKVSASGRGEFFPVGDNKTPEGRAQNRRTEIILTPDLAQLMKILGN